MNGQLELFGALPVQGPSKPRRNLRLVPPPPAHTAALGDRRAPARLDPHHEHGLEDGNAEVIVRGWGRPVTDVHVTRGRL